MGAKNRRELAPPVLGSVSTVLAASLVSGAKTEFGSWPFPRRWLLQTLRLAHLAPFPYR
jgi:hypothetical protein